MKTVIEFNLVRGSGDAEQGLSTHASEGRARMAHLVLDNPDGVRLVKRTATYPLDKAGKPQVTGSKVEEEELPL